MVMNFLIEVVSQALVAASVDNFNNAIDATVSTGNFATEVKILITLELLLWTI